MSDNNPPNSFFSMVTGRTTDEEGVNNPSASIENLNEESPELLGGDSSNPLGEREENSIADESVDPSQSEMPHDARRVLVHLMRQGSVMASQKPKLFEQLCRYQIAIRKHLSEVYLKLVLDPKMGVAFVASATSEHLQSTDDSDFDAEEIDSEASTTLISKRTLSLFDTLILLVLRKHYQDREAAGEQKVTIDIDRLESYLTPFLPITDHASKERKKLVARVKEMVKRKVLSTIRGEEDRYEITPIIRYVVDANFLESMLAEYMALASEQVKDEQTGRDEQL